MKSQTSLAARNCRLQEWSQMVHSCNNRPIGMSVNEWCRENSITTANYYYRMTQVRKACLDSLSDEAVNQEVVPVPMNLVAPAEESCIKSAIEQQKYNEPSKANILKVYDEIEKNQIFGTKEIKEILDCSPSTARAVIIKLRDM